MRGISLDSNGVTEPFFYPVTDGVFAACRRIITEDRGYAEGARIDATLRSLNA